MTEPSRRAPRRERLASLTRWLDHETWSGCLGLMALATAVLWIIEIVNETMGHHLDRFGLEARTLDGLTGLLTMPFLHASAGHLAANMFPFLIVGWVVLVGGTREFLLTTAVVMLGGGLLTWLVAPSGRTIVGASALVFGWLGYLVGRAVFSRRFVWIIVAAALLIFFSGLFTGLLPSHKDYIAWQAHLSSFAVGVAAGWWLHPRKGTDRYLKVKARGGE